VFKGLLKRKGHFIVSGTTWAESHGQIAWSRCKFDRHSYSPNLYLQLKIGCPASIGDAVAKRQSEYLAGRYVASQAMRAASIPYGESLLLFADENRCPIWPSGVIGSISHCMDQAVCIVAKQDHLSALGVDVELLLSTESASQIHSRVHTQSELFELTSLGFETEIATTVIFSAKESFFKAFYPRVKTFFGFETVQVVAVDMNNGSLIFRVDESFKRQYRLRSYYRCYFTVMENNVLTYIFESRNHVS
jgi:enterobactin synthetase component D / holo-[acyl-carrier protein] synthase